MTHPSRLSGLAKDIQTAFAILYWGWLSVLLQPQDILMLHPKNYAGFLLIGDRAFWVCFTAPAAIVGAVALFTIPFWIRQLLTGMQIGWLLAVTVFFSLTWPPVTGLPAYGAFLFLAACLLRRQIYAERG